MSCSLCQGSMPLPPGSFTSMLAIVLLIKCTFFDKVTRMVAAMPGNQGNMHVDPKCTRPKPSLWATPTCFRNEFPSDWSSTTTCTVVFASLGARFASSTCTARYWISGNTIGSRANSSATTDARRRNSCSARFLLATIIAAMAVGCAMDQKVRLN
eukprot:CAMPEP_0115277520 /NCGR_PEP_ID=MMETSP0270-20121206/57282_1 /TAXON_ID=71861 /ORGANISM="Scrippsiella trochoidea, Strain CCMP3099" /LENGTH=154 /DNA_ID=CAMNT_0002694163 /DNA_START=114 /DNA_END=575 /DNA_ORIENTATION=+